jgi:hypothetical protein
MMIGLPATVNPGDWNPRTPDRLPSWKIQTSAPKEAVIESSVMITALIGMTTEPNSRNRITALAPRVSAIAYGIVADWLVMKSLPWAASPPTWAVTPSTDTPRTSGITAVPAGVTGEIGLIASSRTVEPRM